MLQRNVGSCTFKGMIDLVPYTNKRGVSPIAILDMILVLHDTPDNSSTHFPFASSNHLCIMFIIVMLEDSTGCWMWSTWNGIG